MNTFLSSIQSEVQLTILQSIVYHNTGNTSLHPQSDSSYKYQSLLTFTTSSPLQHPHPHELQQDSFHEYHIFAWYGHIQE